MPEIGGVITAMVTPFTEDLSVDEAAARSLARHLIENGSHGLVLAGTTGESPTSDDAEKLSLLRAVREEVGPDVLVICGTGSNDTRHSERLSAAAADAGADAVLAVTPYYNKPNFTGIKAHYEAVARAAGIPVLLYNIPVAGGGEHLAGAARRARADRERRRRQAGERRRAPADRWAAGACRQRRNVPQGTRDGGAGGVLVASQLAGLQMRGIYDAAQAGDMERAREIDDGLRPLYDVCGKTNPIPVKAGLELLGVCSARARLPIVEADEEQRAEVRRTLEAQGLLAGSAA